MTEDEAAQLLRETHGRLRELGLGDLAERLVEAVGPDPGSSSRQMLLTLDALDAELRAQDGGTARQVVDRLGEVARTPEGGRPEGLWIDLAPEHQRAFGLDGADLTAGPDLSGPLDTLRELRLRMEDDGASWR